MKRPRWLLIASWVADSDLGTEAGRKPPHIDFISGRLDLQVTLKIRRRTAGCV